VTDLNSLLAISGLAALLVLMISAWMLRRRLRSRSSSALAWSLTLLTLWPFLSNLSTYLVLNYGNPSQPHPAVNWIVVTVEVFLPSLLFLVVAVSFFLSVRGVAARSNNSFKRKPLRGSP
jgi:hypothetical protein